MDKWEINRKYFNENFYKLRKLFGGKNIIIVEKRVRFAIVGFDGWVDAYNTLTPEEQEEAYHIYMPRENEFNVI